MNLDLSFIFRPKMRIILSRNVELFCDFTAQGYTAMDSDMFLKKLL
jgi:hypothetical protein